VKYILYHGTSSYLSLEAVHSHIEKIKEKDSSTSVNIVDADSIAPENILDLLASPSLFTSKRTIFLKRVYRNKDRKNLTENIIDILKENKGDDLLIFWEDQKIRSNTRYYKFFKEQKAVEEISELNKRTFFTWLRKELEKNNLKIDQSVIKDLAERTNYDPERCKNQIEKFKLNNLDKIIEKEDIETLIADTLEKEIWDLTDAINQQDKKRSVSILERLSSKSTDANYILAMLARNLRLIYLTKHLTNQGKDYKKISSLLQIPPFTTPALVKASSQYSNEKIKLLYSKLSNLDFQIKTGRIEPTLGLTLICPFL
jgi:DNA polymerase III subunit delta